MWIKDRFNQLKIWKSRRMLHIWINGSEKKLQIKIQRGQVSPVNSVNERSNRDGSRLEGSEAQTYIVGPKIGHGV